MNLEEAQTECDRRNSLRRHHLGIDNDASDNSDVVGLEAAVELFNREYNIFREPRQMDSQQAWKTLKDLRYNGKKKLSMDEKRALEYAMVRICEEVGRRMLSEQDNA